MAGAQLLGDGVADRLRRLEVGLADAEGDDVDTLAAQLVGARRDRERQRGLDAPDALGDLHPATPGLCRWATRLSATSTSAGTRPRTSPPSIATSLTSDEET